MRLAMLLMLAACTPTEDSDTEVDSDTTADTDTEVEPDTEADTEADTEPPYEGPLRTFVSTRYSANMGGPAQADALCQDDENNPDPRSTWKAMLAGTARAACGEADCANGATGQIDWVFYADTEYVRSDGSAFLTTNADGIVTNYPIANQVLDTAGINFWTGLERDWTTSSRTCVDWTSDGTARGTQTEGRVGWSQSTGRGWIEGGQFGCARTAPLFCVEQ